MAKNLAGLAALGALGLLMSRKQGGGNSAAGVPDDVQPRRTFGETPNYAPGQGPDTTGAGWETEVSMPEDTSYATEAFGNRTGRVPVRTNRPSNASQGLDANGRPLPLRNIPQLPDVYIPDNTQGRSTQGPVRMVQGARPAGPVGPESIPGGGPTVQGGEPVDNPSELGKIIQGLGVGAGVAGVGAGAYKAKKYYDALKAADRSAVTNPNMWTAGPKEASKFGKSAKELIKDKLMEKGLLKKELSEADTTGGAGKYGYKKGGTLKAKGKAKTKTVSSSTTRSSASKRGDGIASKGRTRGKMY